MEAESTQRSIGSSQFIARIFELVCYILLIPALPAALFGIFAVLTFDGLGQASDPVAEARVTPDEWGPALGIVAILLVGCVLLWGYRRHSRGRDGLRASLLLWLATVLYNGAPLGWLLSEGVSPTELSWVLMLVLWWLTAIVLALAAAALDLRALSSRS